HGIHLVVVAHLPQTYLDGAAMFLADKTPVIGLTLRHDRVDNFWFALLHELAHLGRHLDDGNEVFIDDHNLRKREGENLMEKEADEWAEEALMPADKWDECLIRGAANEAMVVALAEKLEVNPAVIAGRIRFEQNNYRLLTRLVGQGEIRKHFPEFKAIN
ncbi:MAG: ImmA/IrrE family metallo-endopeptidase, partial [Deltaproteobacteria bacterium]|nr:ImmA/IrrE family metallo-endopeptidase [Deltaproteobacteria bacterium]